MPCITCASCIQCKLERIEKKKLSASASRIKYEKNHPGRAKMLCKQWQTLNKSRISARNKAKYAEQKLTGDTYYQKNKERILAASRLKYLNSVESDEN